VATNVVLILNGDAFLALTAGGASVVSSMDIEVVLGWAVELCVGGWAVGCGGGCDRDWDGCRGCGSDCSRCD